MYSSNSYSSLKVRKSANTMDVTRIKHGITKLMFLGEKCMIHQEIAMKELNKIVFLNLKACISSEISLNVTWRIYSNHANMNKNIIPALNKIEYFITHFSTNFF
jgi:hypothetical protein